MARFFLFSSAFLLLILTGCDIKGANDPYSYAPQTAHSVWIPPEKQSRRVRSDFPDFSYLAKEQPISLAEVIDVALFNNPQTTRTWAFARMAAASYGQSLKNFFPLAEIDMNYNRSRSAQFTGSDREIVYETVYGGAVCLSYLIFDFGQTRATSQAALESLYNADWSHNREIQTVMQSVMTDYYSYLYAKDRLIAKEQDVVSAQVALDAVMEKLQMGVADIADKVQATTKLLQQQLEVVMQKQSLTNAYTTLIADMGVPANEKYIFQGFPTTIRTFEVETLDNLILAAMENRPDLLAAESNVKSKEASLLAAERKRYPKVNGGFDFGRTYYQRGLNDTYDFSATVSLSFPLFQGFYLDNGIKLARAHLKKAESNLSQVKLGILQNVTNYREDVGYAAEALEYAYKFLASAEEDFRLNLEKYRAGTATIVDLINAQSFVADARSQLVETERDWFQSLANLAYATGMLVPTDEKYYQSFRETYEENRNET